MSESHRALAGEHPATVLVVDDNEAGRYAKAHTLQAAGFRILEAATGKDALRMAFEEHPAVVLLDIKLPDIDGFAVCSSIKNDPGTAGIMILQVSAYLTSTQDQVLGLEGGADAYIPGDIGPGLLIATVRALLRTRRAEQALHEREERLRLMEAVERSRQELRAVTAALLTAQEDERRRIAREMHDDFAQRLAVLEFSLSNLRSRAPNFEAELTAMTVQVQNLTRDICNLSHALHPSALEDLGLEAALQRLCEDFESKTSVGTRFIRPRTQPTMKLSTASMLYRVAQEALHNVAKHAGDARVTITLDQHGDEWCLTVHDDGCGFDTNTGSERPALGLASMHERAKLERGRLEVASEPGQGTTIRVWAPYRLEKPGNDGQRHPARPAQSEY